MWFCTSLIVASMVTSIIAPSSVALAADLRRAVGVDYAPVRNEVLRIIEEFPPDRYYYLNIGRCLTPVIAQLQEILGQDAAQSVPFSQLMHFEPPGIRVYVYPSETDETFESYWRARERLYTPENIATFRGHLAAYLPTAARVGGRRVLVIDWSDHGRSIVNLMRELDRFAEHAPPDRKHRYEFYALTAGDPDLTARLREHGVRVRAVGPRAVRIFRHRRYRGFAEHGKPAPWVESAGDHGAVTDTGTRTEAPVAPASSSADRYVALRAAYRARVAGDPHVRRALVRTGATHVTPPSDLERARCACERALDRAHATCARIARTLKFSRPD